MNQIELVEWLKPPKYNQAVHIIIKNKYKKYCVGCQRSVVVNEYCLYNKDKKTIRHVNCDDQHLKLRPKRVPKYKWKPILGGGM